MVSIYASDVFVDTIVDSKSDIIIREDRYVDKYILGIKIASYKFKRNTNKEDVGVGKSSEMGFKRK